MRLPAGFALIAVCSPALAQTPPRPLPASITGATPPSAVQPASVAVAAPPIQRFADLRAQLPETVQAIYAMRGGADWLWRMNQPNGRFVAGVNPALKQSLPDDSDFRQAVAALALCRAARFTGDERLAVRAAQSVLVMASLVKVDPADPSCTVPTFPPERGNRIGFAALVALAIFELPTADPRLGAEAEGLCMYLRKRCAADGSVQAFETADGAKADPDGAHVYAGVALQALAAAYRLKPDPKTRDAVARGLVYYRGTFQAQPHPLLAASVLPAAVDYYLVTKDQAAAGIAFELADGLCSFQYTRADARQAVWAGGFRTVPSAALGGEPTADAATCAQGLAAAATLTRHAPDVARFAKYRQACVDALLFTRNMQFTDENAEHFEKGFRGRFLSGGIHSAPTDGTIRADTTGNLVSACVRYLESGAETRPE